MNRVIHLLIYLIEKPSALFHSIEYLAGQLNVTGSFTNNGENGVIEYVPFETMVILGGSVISMAVKRILCGGYAGTPDIIPAC